LQRSFLLDDIVVKAFELDSNCFEVYSRNDVKDPLVLCGCPFETSSKDAAVSWIKEIQKFRDNCASKDSNKIININSNSKIKMNLGNETIEVSGDKLKQLARNSLESKVKDKQTEEDEKQQQKINDELNQVESITSNYTKNEFFKERLLETEEELKSKNELENLDKMIQKEAEK